MIEWIRVVGHEGAFEEDLTSLPFARSFFLLIPQLSLRSILSVPSRVNERAGENLTKMLNNSNAL